MRAALYRSHGPARDVLRVEEIDRPEPGPGEVRVRVLVSGLNPTDCKNRSGATGRSVDDFQIPHHDGAGVIDAVGAGVSPERVGQRVWLWFAAAGRRWGTAAEWSVVPEHQAVPLPDGVSLELGATLGVPALTAHRCLFADGPLDGRTVLVAGGAGAVGHFAIELAKQAGARVIATVSTPAKADLAVRAGADHVLNYLEPGAVDELRAITPRVDRVIEVALGANLDLDLAVAGPETVIAIYATEAQDPTLPLRACLVTNVTLRFVWLYGVPVPELVQASSDVAAALTAGALNELPVHRFPLSNVAEAHEAVEAGVVGKVLLDVA